MIDKCFSLYFRALVRTTSVVFALVALAVVGVQPISAQTFTTIYNFTLGADGGGPLAGPTLDRAGNLYGTTGYGGTGSDGTVYKLANRNGSWILTPLYEFQGGSDGATSNAPISIGPSGALFGSTLYGGGAPNCGILFELQPPPTTVAAPNASWKETILHTFAGGSSDGCSPASTLTWDRVGNVYGTTQIGGAYGEGGGFNGYGTVFELTPSSSGWTESILYNFSGGPLGNYPLFAGIVFDNAGAMYGTLEGGGDTNGDCGVIGCGVVYKLISSNGTWTESVLYTFTGSTDGQFPQGGVIFDGSGNLYGGAVTGGSGQGGTVFQLTPSSGDWNFNLLASLEESPEGAQGVETPLAFDSQGNLYGTTHDDGQYGLGTLFKLTPTLTGWTYTDLHDFTGGDDGAYPVGPVVFDSQGNLYGTAIFGGSYGVGVIYELTVN
jgi:uncharacterized repeat protein (TIGR03803 family)